MNKSFTKLREIQLERFYIHLYYSFFFIVLFLNATAQKVVEGSYAFIHFSSSSGLPQNNVSSIVQTPDGYTWLGTFQGLVRYDGSEFKSFSFQEIENLQSDVILDMCVDSHEVLWIITEKEILYYKDKRFSHIKLNRNFNFAYTKLIHANEKVFFLNRKEVFKIENGTCKLVYTSKKDIDYIGVNDNYLFVHIDSKIVAQVSNNGQITSINFKDSITSIACSKNTLKVFTTNDYYEFEEGIENNKTNLLPSLFAKNISKVKSCNSNYFYFFDNNKLFLYDLLSKEIEIVTISKKLSASDFNKLFIDINDNRWLLTLSNGIYFLHPKIAKTHTISYYRNKKINSGGTFTYLHSDSIHLYYNGYEKGIVKINTNTDSIIENVYNTGHMPWSMLVDDRDSIWIAEPYANRVSIYNPKKDKLNNLKLPLESYNLIFQTKDHKIWVASNNNVCQTSDYKNFNLLRPNQPLKHSHQMIEDSKGNLWIATKNGIFLYNKKEWKHYDKTDGLPTNDCRALYIDKDENLWIGTAGFGLCRFKNESFVNYSQYSKHFNQNVWAIVEDDYGYLWYTSNQGVYNVKKSDLNKIAENRKTTIRTSFYNERDGLVSSEFNSRTQNKGYKDKNGMIWFSSIAGPVEINPHKVNRLRNKKKNFNLIIDKIFIGEKEISNFNNQIVQFKSVSNIQCYINFPDYYDQNNVFFQYKIPELDTNWININNKIISINHLSSGDYHLFIKEINTNKELVINIKVIPAFYQKIWVIVCFVILLFIVVIYVIIYVIRRINLTKMNKHKEVQNLKMMLLQNQMNPHFIFNILASIQGYVVKKDPIKASDYVSKLSVLMRNTLNNANKLFVPIHEELYRAKLYLDLEKLRNSRFDYMIDCSIDDAIYIPNMIIQPILENAVVHGVSSLPKEKMGLIKISLQLISNKISICIEDNGEGYNPNKQSKHGYNSIGLSNVAQRINSIPHGSFVIDSKTNICDTGTIVTIIIPIEHYRNSK